MRDIMHLTLIEHRRLLVAFVIVAACTDDGSLGTYPESSGAEEASGSGTDDTTASTTAGTTTTVSTTAGSEDVTTATTQPTEDEGSGDDATAGETGSSACEQPGNCVDYPPPCGDAGCGGLNSQWDENGCLRQECDNHRQCDEGELCYHAIDFGGCFPTGFACGDDPETQSCVCGTQADCGGGFCVPEEIYPMAGTLPDVEVGLDNYCAPNDGPAFLLHWGGEGASNGCALPGEVALLLVVNQEIAVGSFGLQNFEDGFGTYRLSTGEEIDVVTAMIDVTAFDGATIDATVFATLPPNVDGVDSVSGDIVAVPYCDNSFGCG